MCYDLEEGGANVCAFDQVLHAGIYIGRKGVGGRTYKAQIVSGGMPPENYFYFLCG